MPKSQDWLIVSSLALGMSVAASLGGTGGALLGSATGAVIGATISSKKLLSSNQQDKAELERLKAELQVLIARVNELRKAQAELAKVEGQFVQRREELQQVEQRLISLKRDEKDLECRVAIIMQQNPQLMEQEKLKSRIEQFRLEKNTLEGQTSALTSQLERLETEKRSLQSISVEYNTKKVQLDALNQ